MTHSTPPRAICMSVLSNGIRVITEAMPAVRSAAVGLWIGGGSRVERPAENGISHFIEHMLFKGTRARSAEEIARQFDSIGGHCDAYTGRELVSYSAKVLDEHLPIAFEVLSDMLTDPLFAPEDVEKEKGVVLEELKMDHDSPEALVHDLFVARFWSRHPLGRPILGTTRSIRAFAPEQLRGFHARRYHASNLLVTAAGSVRHEEVTALTERWLGGLPARGEETRLTAPVPHASIELKSKRSLEQIQVCVGVPCYPAAHPKRFAAYVLNLVLGGGMSSRLFQEIRERQGLAYSIYSELNLYQDAGCLAVYAGTSAQTLGRLINSVLAEFRRVKQEPLEPGELQRAKDNMKGSLVLSLESTSSRMSNLARQWIQFNRFFTLDEIIASIDAVTAGEVLEAAREFLQPGKVAVTLLGRLNGFGLERADLVC
jgi:predicted Zn-dependent peptidase